MKFECPACAQHLDGESAYAGRTITCPACGHAFVVPQTSVTAAAHTGLVEIPTGTPTVRPALPASTAGRSAKTSKLAIASLALSSGSLFLGPFGFIPGIVCGHLAKANLRRDAMLGGARVATAGLAIGYSFLVVMVAGGVILLTNIGGLTPRVLQSLRQPAQIQTQPSTTQSARVTRDTAPSAGKSESGSGGPADVRISRAAVGTNDYSVIDMQNPVIPSQPAAGPVNGSMFYVRRAKIEDTDLILIGDSSGDVPAIRLHPEPGAQTRSQFNVLPLVQNAARFKVATQLQPNGMLAKSCTVTLRTADGSMDLTSDAGIRLVFHSPQNGVCKSAIHLAFGPDRKEYVLGEFLTELSPELIGRVKELKRGFTFPDFRRSQSKQ